MKSTSRPLAGIGTIAAVAVAVAVRLLAAGDVVVAYDAPSWRGKHARTGGHLFDEHAAFKVRDYVTQAVWNQSLHA